MAATDYLTMKRVRALDYIIPPVCDADAAGLIKRLLVCLPLSVTMSWLRSNHSHRYLTLLNELVCHQNLHLRISVNTLFSSAKNHLRRRNHHKKLGPS